MQQTSLDAYNQAVRPHLGEKQREVYNMLKQYPDLTNQEIRLKLGWQISTVTPRTKELRQMKYVIESGKRQCRVTGFRVMAWKIVNTLL